MFIKLNEKEDWKLEICGFLGFFGYEVDMLYLMIDFDDCFVIFVSNFGS